MLVQQIVEISKVKESVVATFVGHCDSLDNPKAQKSKTETSLLIFVIKESVKDVMIVNGDANVTMHINTVDSA